MQLHSNAKLTPSARLLLVQRITQENWTVSEAAEAAGISRRTAHKWLSRFRSEGAKSLCDRSSRPHTSPRETSPGKVERIERLRRKQFSADRISERMNIPRSTVSAILKRIGIPRLKCLEVKEPVRRYEKEDPGELLHLDTKTLARIRKIGHRITGNRRDTTSGAGYEYVHVAIDDATRVARAEVLSSLDAQAAIGFLRRTLKWYRARGVKIRGILTDNGSCYISKEFGELCKKHGIRHYRTRPYRPQTNGKAERWIKTLIEEWAYRKPYSSSAKRTQALAHWVRRYNTKRKHGSLSGMTPYQRLALQV